MPTLLIPDVHQNLDFARRSLELADPGDAVVFLGDYFDSRDPEWSGEDAFVATLEALAEWAARPGTVCLLGNHDLPVMTSCPPHFTRYPVPGFDLGRTQRHLDRIAQIPWEEFRLFHYVAGWLVSHAGFHRDYWQGNTVEEGLLHLERLCDTALDSLNERNQLVFQAGRSRGGHVPHPGPTWQCWSEFEDSLPLPQIVGHTSVEAPEAKGLSWNLDCAQTHVAWIREGELSFVELGSKPTSPTTGSHEI